MKNNVLISLSIVALLMIGSVNTASAQRNKNREKTEFVQKDGTKENTVSQSAKQNAVNDIESLYAANTAKFDSVKDNVERIRTLIEHPVLRKGDSTRVKFLINPQVVTALEVKGYGKATPEEIKSGCYTITIKAEESTFFVFKFSDSNGISVGANFIIVTEPENVIEYTTKQNKYIENQDFKSLGEFRKKVVGEEFYRNSLEQMNIYRKQQ